jgi:hypothetical protein
MSDFLGNLVTRSLAPAAQISPRLPSLFEPPQASGIQAGVAPWQEGESSEGEQDGARPAAAPPAAPRLRGRPQSAVSVPRDGSLPDDVTAPPPYRGRQIPPAAPLSVETVAAELAPEPSSLPGPVQSLSEPRADRGGAAEPAKPVPVEPAMPGRETLPPETPPPAAQALPTREGATIVARPRTRLAQPAEPVPAEGKQPVSGPESPPTIRVTIGRVEVRAVMPPAPEPAPPPRHAPRLSLDDYLKQRSGESP